MGMSHFFCIFAVFFHLFIHTQHIGGKNMEISIEEFQQLADDKTRGAVRIAELERQLAERKAKAGFSAETQQGKDHEGKVV